jgi:crotonobetaine/carnitine-CoA ligase
MRGGGVQIRDSRLGYAIRDLTIGNVVARQAERWGDKVYLTFLPDRLQFTYRQLDEITNRVANGLMQLGLARGSHLGMLMENCPESLFALVAVGKIGGVAAPINAAARGEQLRYFIDLFDAVAIVVEQALLERVLEVLPQSTRLKHVVVIPEGRDLPEVPKARLAHAQLVSYRDLERASPERPKSESRFSDLGMLAFTSGTTGPSKGNMHTQAKCLLNPISHCEVWECTSEDVFYTALPAFHTNALHATLYPALVVGGSAVLSRRFSASNYWRELRETGATVVNLLGSMANILWAQPPSPDDGKHKLRVVGAGPVPTFHREFEERFKVRLNSAYGLTDFGVPTYLPPDAPPGKKRATGKPRPGWQVRIVDDDDFDMPVGQVGEIALRTDNLWEASLGYYKMPEKTLEAFRNGWWHTGDRGYLDEDGYMWFVDRKKDAMRRRGENISSFEVEQAIIAHPAVAEAAVFPVKSEMAEDEVGAAVVLRAGMSLAEADLIEHCRQNMAYFMVPRFLQFLPELPRTLTQKVEKYKLKAAADADVAMLWDREKAGIVIRRDARR